MSMKIFLTNLGKYNEGYLVGMWVKLPVPQDKLDEVLVQIGINEEYEECFITDFETSFVGMRDVISEYSSIVALNKLSEKIEGLSEDEQEKLDAVLECEGCRSVSDVLELIEELDSFDLLSDVDDDEALGCYYADECCCIDIPDHIKSYFDYEAYGRDIRLESCCTYTSYGCLIDNR